MDYQHFYESIKTHVERLCTDEMRAHAFADKSHDLDFQVLMILVGYKKALEDLKAKEPPCAG